MYRVYPSRLQRPEMDRRNREIVGGISEIMSDARRISDDIDWG